MTQYYSTNQAIDILCSYSPKGNAMQTKGLDDFSDFFESIRAMNNEAFVAHAERILMYFPSSRAEEEKAFCERVYKIEYQRRGLDDEKFSIK